MVEPETREGEPEGPPSRQAGVTGSSPVPPIRKAPANRGFSLSRGQRSGACGRRMVALDVGTDPAEALAPLRPQLEALVARDVEAEIARLVGVQVERLNGAGE